MHILPNISRSKGNQTIKFGQLIGYNIKKIFVEKPYTNCAGEPFPDPHLKNQNWANLWINDVKFSIAIEI